jgi:hypothetical protein
MSPRNDEDEDADRQNTYDENQQQESAYRTISPPVPTLKNKGKKQNSNVRRSSSDDVNQQPVFNDNDDHTQPPIDDNDPQNRQSYRKPTTPRQTGLINNLKKLFVAISSCLRLCRRTASTKKTSA